jgi:hypothetical protein
MARTVLTEMTCVLTHGSKLAAPNPPLQYLGCGGGVVKSLFPTNCSVGVRALECLKMSIASCKCCSPMRLCRDAGNGDTPR